MNLSEVYSAYRGVFKEGLFESKVKWDYESVKAEASKYDSRSAFKKGCDVAYQVARMNGWLDEWFGHLHKSWDYESVKAEASKYDSRGAFRRGCASAYNVALKKGWLDEWFGYQYNSWDYESVKAEASKYDSRKAFQRGCGSAYNVARMNGWIDEFSWLKDKRLDLIKGKIDSVYAYEFTELNAVYVGRTLMNRQKDRDRAHVFDEKDAVVIFAKQNDIPAPKPKYLEQDLTIKEGAEREGNWVEWYREQGWTILNRAKTGSIGALGKGKWNYETVKAEASKYDSRSAFQRGCPGAYKVARKNGWLDEWFGHQYKYWDYESVKAEASKYDSRSAFERGCASAYNVALKKGWLDEWFGHQHKSWNYESVKAEASKFDSRSAFERGCVSAYNVARKNGWLDEWFGHQRKSWDYETLKAEASKYNLRSAFHRGCSGAYEVALKNKWLDEFFPKS